MSQSKRANSIKQVGRFGQRAVLVGLPAAACGSLDLEALEQTRRILTELSCEPEPPCLILDLSSVASIGAGFLGVLVSTLRGLKRHGRTLALTGLKPGCEEVLRVSRLDRAVTVYPTWQDAAKAVRVLATEDGSDRADDGPWRLPDLPLTGVL